MYSHSNPVPLRSHKKSFKGCLACKKRKVKCDEKRPVCGRCAIHFDNLTACEYNHDTERRPKKSALVLPKRKDPTPPSSDPCLSSGTSDSSKSRSSSPSRTFSSNVENCKCPCHVDQFTDIMLDAIWGICRVCGNSPSPGVPKSECKPALSPSLLMNGKLDPFHILPMNSTHTNELMHHWVNTLSLQPTSINTEYCTNPWWISLALSNPPLFNVTLYVCSTHLDSLRNRAQSAQSLFFKTETIKVLNDVLRDPAIATTDETISAIWLLGIILNFIGETAEVNAHLQGLQSLVALRGGIATLIYSGCFLQMLCTSNHLSAVLTDAALADLPNSSSSPSPDIPKTPCNTDPTTSPLFIQFATSVGFSERMVTLFHSLGYLHAILDAFTMLFMPIMRPQFEALGKEIERTAGEVAFEDPNPERLTSMEMRILSLAEMEVSH